MNDHDFFKKRTQLFASREDIPRRADFPQHVKESEDLLDDHVSSIASWYQSELASANKSREFSIGRGVKQGDVMS